MTTINAPLVTPTVGMPQGIIPAVDGYNQYQNSALIPQEIVSARARIAFGRSSIIRLISDTNPLDELKNSPGTQTIRFPLPWDGLRARPLLKNGVLTSDQMSTDSCSITVGKAKYIQVKTDGLDHMLMPGFMSKALADSIESALATHAMAVDCEVLAQIPISAHCANTGNHAGFRSHSIDLGSPLAPIVLNETNVLTFLLSLPNVFAEHNIKANSVLGRPYAIANSALRGLLARSSVAMRQFEHMGASPLMVAGMGDQDVYTLSPLNMDIINADMIPAMPAPNPADGLMYRIVFGYPGATAYADLGAGQMRQVIDGTHDSLMRVERIIHTYGYGVIYPKAVGVAYVAIKPPQY